jgi:hypothetical protein
MALFSGVNEKELYKQGIMTWLMVSFRVIVGYMIYTSYLYASYSQRIPL